MKITHNIYTNKISLLEITLDDFVTIQAALGVGSTMGQEHCKDLIKRIMDLLEECHVPQSVEGSLQMIEQSQRLRSKLGID